MIAQFCVDYEGVEVVRSEREADWELAQHCIKRDSLAVVSNDSDFIIFDIPGFVPFWGLEFNPASILPTCSVFLLTVSLTL